MMILNPYRYAAAGPSGFPVYLGATTTGVGTSGTAHNISMPATVNAGDLLVAQLAIPTTATVTVPAGWTLIRTFANIMRVGAYYKVADGSEGGATVDFVTSAATFAAAIVHRVEAGTFDAAAAPTLTDVIGTSTTPDPTTHTPAWGALNTLWIVAFGGVNAGSVSAYPYVGSNTHIGSHASGSGTGCEVASCVTSVNAASINPGAFARTEATRWIAQTLAIKPA